MHRSFPFHQRDSRWLQSSPPAACSYRATPSSPSRSHVPRVVLVDLPPQLQDALHPVLNERSGDRSCEYSREAPPDGRPLDADVLIMYAAGGDASIRPLWDVWRRFAPQAAVIALSPSLQPAILESAFRDGADDVLGLPCTILDLVSRVEITYQRTRYRRESDDAVRSGAGLRSPDVVELNVATRAMRYNGRAVLLTNRECAFGEFLFRKARTPVSRQDILRGVWDRDYVKTAPANLADVYARLLRRRLGEVGLGEALQTIRYVGYQLNADTLVT
jgi:DNA-binding response OmpR family regulator